jgi:peptidyl-prolyl cis-trans isomerase B (cyclophilin B)
MAAVTGLAGCHENKGQVEAPSTENKAPTANLSNSIVSAGAAGATPPKTVAVDPKMHVAFEQACVTEIIADDGFSLPPLQTANGHSTGQMNDAVHRIWDQIKFVDTDGKPQTYLAEIEVATGETAIGTIELLMRPELAPNHARNFVALATLGYYDGLRFDRIVKQAYMNDLGSGKLVLLEAGMPTAQFDPPSGHLGYSLKPEFSSQAKHEEGSVGACLLERDNNEETAAVRFYINLTAAPAMDGNFTIFAKVVKGLDVAKRISELPVRSSEPGPEQGRPTQPITIKKVTVRPVPVQ